MNLPQRFVVWFAAVTILLMCAYPPWVGAFQIRGEDGSVGREFGPRHVGYHFILEPPRSTPMTLNIIVGMQHFKSDDPTVITQADSTHFHLDYERLAVQIILALLTTLSLLFVLRRPLGQNVCREVPSAPTLLRG